MVLVIVYVVHVGILLVRAAELIGGLGNANVVVAVHVVRAIRSQKHERVGAASTIARAHDALRNSGKWGTGAYEAPLDAPNSATIRLRVVTSKRSAKGRSDHAAVTDREEDHGRDGYGSPERLSPHSAALGLTHHEAQACACGFW
jgi:hypothetical protein